MTLKMSVAVTPSLRVLISSQVVEIQRQFVNRFNMRYTVIAKQTICVIALHGLYYFYTYINTKNILKTVKEM